MKAARWRFGSRSWAFSPAADEAEISAQSGGNDTRREVELRDNADIYFVLLGLLPGRRPPDHYTLLGLPPLTDSPRQIHAAVERQMAKLTPLLLSPHGRRVQRMIGEVLEARDVLSSERRKRVYDAELVSGRAEPDPTAETRDVDVREVARPADAVSSAPRRAVPAKRNAPAGKAKPRPAAAIDVDSMLPPPAMEPILPAAPAIVLPIPLIDPPQAPAAPDPAAPVKPPNPFAEIAEQRFAPPAKDFSLSEMALDILQPRIANDETIEGNFAMSSTSPFAAPASRPIIAPLAPEAEIIPTEVSVSDFAPFDQPVATQLPSPADAEQHDWPRPLGGDALAGASRGGIMSSRRQDNSQWIAIVTASVIGVAVLVACVGLIASQRKDTRTAETSTTPATAAKAKSGAVQATNPKPPASTEPKPSTTAPNEPASPPTDPKATPPDATSPGTTSPTIEPPKPTAPTAEDPPKPTPVGPESEPKPTPPPMADPAQAKAVTAALTAARTALSKRDVAEAGKELDLALLEATSADLVAKIENEKTLRHYVEGFWGAVRDRIQGLQGGEELAVGKQVVIVVERRGDRIIVRDRGANKTVGVADMPAHLAAALAESWLKKDDPNSAVFVGAFWSVDAKGDVKRGRQILEDAKKNGSDAAASVLEAIGPAK